MTLSRKKILIFLAIVAILGISYLNYYAEETIEYDKDPKIETFEVTYDTNEYHVTARKQIDHMNTKVTYFEYGDLLVKRENYNISGDNIFISPEHNVTVTDNIRAQSTNISDNNWIIESDKLQYTHSKDIISSDKGMTATNTKDNIKIYAENFVTDTKMSYADLDGDVTITRDKNKIIGDSGHYIGSEHLVTLGGNIVFFGEDKNGNNILGNFARAKYDITNKTLTSNDKFDITYRGVTMSGSYISYNEDTEELIIDEDVRVTAAGYDIAVGKIHKRSKNAMIDILGKITGGSDDYQIDARNGVYDVDGKLIRIQGDVTLSSKNGDKILADQITLDTDSQIVTIGSGKQNVKYISGDTTLTTREILYDMSSNEISIEKGYTLSGSGYTISGRHVSYNTKTSLGIIHGEYTVTSGNDTTFRGADATYDSKTGEFVDDGEITVTTGDYTISGETIRYNSKTGIGTLDSQIMMNSSTNDISIVGDSLSFDRDNNIKINGNIIATTNKVVAKTLDGDYNLKDKKIYFNNPITIQGQAYDQSDDDENSAIHGTLENGVYDVDIGIFCGNNFVGEYSPYKLTTKTLNYIPSSHVITGSDIKAISDDSNFTSDSLYGDLSKKYIDFVDNVSGTYNANGTISNVNANRVRLYLNAVSGTYSLTRLELTGDVELTQLQREIAAGYMEMDIARNILYARDKVQIKTDENNRATITATADRCQVDYTNREILLTDNVNVKTKEKNTQNKIQNIEATGGEILVKQDTLTIEVSENAKISTDDGYIMADYIKYDINTKKANAKGNVFIDYKK